MRGQQTPIGSAHTLKVGFLVEPLVFYDPHLPVGSELVSRRNHAHWWRKTGPGRYELGNGGLYNMTDLGGYDLEIRSLPDGKVEVPQPTAEQVKWQFRVGALTAAHAHGYSGHHQVTETVRKIIGDLDLPVGHGMPVDELTRAKLPDGSVVYSGAPDDPDRLTVQVKQNGQWVHVLGERPHLNPLATVDSVNGNREKPEWLARAGTEQDLKEIQEFQARAWRIGWQLKRSMHWCSTYESIMGTLGVTERALMRVPVAGMTVGMRVDAMEASALPVGSLLSWRHRDNPDSWAVYVRDNAVGNRARTRLVVSSEGVAPANYQRRMRIETLIGEDGRPVGEGWQLPTNDLWSQLPAGTVFTFQLVDSPANPGFFVICGDGRAAAWEWEVGARPPRLGSYARNDFGRNVVFRIVGAV